MPLGDITAGLLEIIGQFFLEFVFEILVKGLGYLIVKIFHPRKEVNPDGVLVVTVGILFWFLIGIVIYFAYINLK